MGKKIEVVTTNQKANYPFVVQIKSTKNWSATNAFVSLEAAEARANEVAGKFPNLPVRIEHNGGGPAVTDLLPNWRRKDVAHSTPYDVALWSALQDPPPIGAKVFVTVNNCGPGRIAGYMVMGGFLGVMVRLDEETRPDWHKKQNPTNEPSLAFGSEIVPILKPGQVGTTSGLHCTVIEHYDSLMWNVRVPGGAKCISAREFIPKEW